MKKVLSWLIVVMVMALSIDAYALTAAEARGMSNAQLKQTMVSLKEDALVSFCKEVFAGNDLVLQSRVRVQLQMMLRAMPTAKAKALTDALAAAVSGLSFAVAADGNVVVLVEDSVSEVPMGNFQPRGDDRTKPISYGANRTGL